MGERLRGWLGASGILFLAACAEMPAPPVAPFAPPPSVLPEGERSKLIARHRELVQKHRQTGDLPAAAAQLHILTLLVPGDEGYSRDLAATRAAIEQEAKESLAAGTAAMRAGDSERAMAAMLRVLALDPGNVEAARVVRDIERQRLTRIQADRAAKARQQEEMANNRAPRPAAEGRDTTDTYDLEQRLEMFRAGDTGGGLRELREYVDTNPRDRAARQRIGTVVYDRARELEAKGAREQAVVMYEQAIALRGDAPPGWAPAVQSLKKALSDEFYDKAVRAYRTELAAAIRDLEASLRYDPQNAKAAAKLKEARAAQEKLKLISRDPTPR
jgi:tetratricopeptide (TPR) repeat protein